MQPPSRSVTQLPEQVVSQSMFASTVQRPWQDAAHLALQSAEGGVPMQEPWQVEVHVPSHDALHDASSFFPLHDAAQRPEQSALQLPSQSKLPGLTLQSAWHVVLHEPVQVPLAEALHFPEHFALQLAVTVTGVQLPVQPPLTRNAHVEMSEMTTSPPLV